MLIKGQLNPNSSAVCVMVPHANMRLQSFLLFNQ